MLSLKDAINELISSHDSEVSLPTVKEEEVVTLTSTSTVAAKQTRVENNFADTFPVQSTDPQVVEYEKLMANYEALGRKLAEFKTPPVQLTPTFTVIQPSDTGPVSRGKSQSTVDLKHCMPDNIVSLRDLPFLQRREF